VENASWGAIVSEEIEARIVLENCRALINRINARLSAEEPFLDVSTAEELLLHLEHAASVLDSALSKDQPH
jgi:hypothetical protein